jgi:hypothetical protein
MDASLVLQHQPGIADAASTRSASSLGDTGGGEGGREETEAVMTTKAGQHRPISEGFRGVSSFASTTATDYESASGQPGKKLVKGHLVEERTIDTTNKSVDACIGNTSDETSSAEGNVASQRSSKEALPHLQPEGQDGESMTRHGIDPAQGPVHGAAEESKESSILRSLRDELHIANRMIATLRLNNLDYERRLEQWEGNGMGDTSTCARGKITESDPDVALEADADVNQAQMKSTEEGNTAVSLEIVEPKDVKESLAELHKSREDYQKTCKALLNTQADLDAMTTCNKSLQSCLDVTNRALAKALAEKAQAVKQLKGAKDELKNRATAAETNRSLLGESNEHYVILPLQLQAALERNGALEERISQLKSSIERYDVRVDQAALDKRRLRAKIKRKQQYINFLHDEREALKQRFCAKSLALDHRAPYPQGHGMTPPCNSDRSTTIPESAPSHGDEQCVGRANKRRREKTERVWDL